MGPGPDSEALLRDRTNAYWQHKVKKEFAEAYLMEAPEVRKGVSVTDYVQASAWGVIWIAVSVESVSIQGDQGAVKIKITYAMLGMYAPQGGIIQVITDCWQYVEGQWYHLPDCPKKKKRWGSGS